MMGAEKPEQIIGKSIWEIVHPEYHKLAKERIKIETEQGKPVPLAEEKFIRLDKKIIDTEVAGAPTVFEGKPAVMVIMHDITDRKRKEKEVEALNKTLIGRELKMEELKKEIESLKKELEKTQK